MLKEYTVTVAITLHLVIAAYDEDAASTRAESAVEAASLALETAIERDPHVMSCVAATVNVGETTVEGVEEQA